MSAALEHAQWTELIGVNDFDHIVGSGIVVLILVAVSLKIKKHCSNNNSIVPSEKFSLTNFFEFLALDFLLDLLTGIFGSEEKAKKFLPLLGGSFLFIFFTYNYLGFKEHGAGYLKHFMGPVLYLAPLMIFIEVVSHLVRPASLSLRLFWNMFGDHLVLQIFSNLTPYIVPAIFIGLGVFVSFLQAFIFTILSSIYISLSTSHDH